MPPTTSLSHLRGCTSPNSAPFLPYFKKNAWKKIFSIALMGAPAPPAPPGYAYEYKRSACTIYNITLGQFRRAFKMHLFGH